MNNKRRIKVTIDGRDYTIIGSQPAHHIEAVVEIVNNQLSQLAKLDPRLSSEDRALLMAVNAVSDQLLKEEKIMKLEMAFEQAKYMTSSQAGMGLQKESSSKMKEPQVPFNRSNSKHKR